MSNGNGKKRRIMLVIEDGDKPDQFTFTMQGDCERIGMKDVNLVPSAAEHWAMEFFNACQDVLKNGPAKKLNREERRRG